MDYNEKVNNGKEVSVIEYIKRINPNRPFLKKYENQKKLRTASYEEFKICGFNFILLLFESVVRVLTTVSEHKPDVDREASQMSAKGKKSK